MKTKIKKRISALSELSITKLNDKLNQITDEDFDVAKRIIINTIIMEKFSIMHLKCNVKYSLYSSIQLFRVKWRKMQMTKRY